MDAVSSEHGPGHSACLSGRDTASHIASRKPVAPPGLNEPHMKIDGVVAACVCFAETGKVTHVSIVSGPAMMQQSVLESLKGWRFRPVTREGHRNGACGTLRLHVAVIGSQVTSKIEE